MTTYEFEQSKTKNRFYDTKELGPGELSDSIRLWLSHTLP